MKIHNQKAFTLIELLVTLTIISLMVAGGYAALSSGEASWFTAEAGIQVQENLRKALDQMTEELRQSKFSQVAVVQSGGTNSTDTIQFSIPVICHVGDNLLDNNGDVAHWGATLRWGCRDAACMDSNDTCSSVEYKFIKYEVISGNTLVRQVLNPAATSVRQDVIAHNISDFQIVAPDASSPMTLTLSSQVQSVLNRALTATVQNSVDFRNK